MSQFVNYLRSIASNRKALEGLILIVLVVVVWVIYNNLVSVGKNPGTLYVASQTLYPGDIINRDKVSVASVSKKYLSKIPAVKQGGADFEKINSGEYCIKEGYSIPEGGLIYLDALTSDNCGELYKDDKFDGTFYVYKLPVDNFTTYGNSLLPGSYIDLYAKIAPNYEMGVQKMVYQKFIEHIKVFKVSDSKGRDVFGQDPYGTPAYLWFKVVEADWDILNAIEKLSRSNVTLIPVPRGAEYSEKFQKEGENIKSEDFARIKRMIDAVSITVSNGNYSKEEN